MARRGPVELRRIEDRTSRQVRFSKRPSELFKKAFELAVLCDVEVSLLVFSPAGKLYEYASNSIEDTYKRYQQFAGTERNVNDADQSNNDEASDLQSRLRAIATCVDEADASELEKLEKLLTNALRDMRVKKKGRRAARMPLPNFHKRDDERHAQRCTEQSNLSKLWAFYGKPRQTVQMLLRMSTNKLCRNCPVINKVANIL